jgi:hypothetical protein
VRTPYMRCCKKTRTFFVVKSTEHRMDALLNRVAPGFETRQSGPDNLPTRCHAPFTARAATAVRMSSALLATSSPTRRRPVCCPSDPGRNGTMFARCHATSSLLRTAPDATLRLRCSGQRPVPDRRHRPIIVSRPRPFAASAQRSLHNPSSAVMAAGSSGARTAWQRPPPREPLSRRGMHLSRACAPARA